MSVSLESWEGILSTVQQFYSSELQPYYNNEYLNICLEVIGMSIGKSSFNYVFTIVSLQEPICVNNNIIIISLPMLQHLLDKSVVFPENKLEQVDNFDIFKDFNILQQNNMDKYDNCVSDYMVRWNTRSVENSGFQRITTSQTVSMVILFRLVVCVAHWLQHYKLKTGPGTHEHFHDIEVADLKKKFDNMTNLQNNSNTAKRFKKLYSNHSSIDDYLNTSIFNDSDKSDEYTETDTDNRDGNTNRNDDSAIVKFKKKYKKHKKN